MASFRNQNRDSDEQEDDDDEEIEQEKLHDKQEAFRKQCKEKNSYSIDKIYTNCMRSIGRPCGTSHRTVLLGEDFFSKAHSHFYF